MSDPVAKIIRTRFAPSPSGNLHVGGARTALFCWAYARKHTGRFILRIEDTDQKRSSDAASVGFLKDLDWLGIEWDEGPRHESNGGGEHGPYFCSQRLEIYRSHIESLIEQGKAYRAFETPEELQAAREKARVAKENYRYDRAALDLDAATTKKYLMEERPYVVRFRVPDDIDDVVFHDEVLGEIRTPADELDDFVILKADGWPTYHFAVVVDDELMQVTHVIRGQEHVINTPRHVLLQDALKFRRPTYAHVSVIFNPDGSKMSKRDKDKALRQAVQDQNIESSPVDPASNQPIVGEDDWSKWQSHKTIQLPLADIERLAEIMNVMLPEINVDDFKRAGYLPEVLLNYLALLGWSPGDDIEKFDKTFFVERFDLDRLVKSPAKFDRDKLLAFNHDALQELDASEFADRLRKWAEENVPSFVDAFDKRCGRDQFAMFAAINQERSKTLRDPIDSCRFLILDDREIEYEQTKGVRKALVNGEPNGYTRLEQIAPVLREIETWTPESIEKTIHAFAETRADGNFGKVAQPLRVAVTGGTASPAIFETLALLGRESVVARIVHCLASREMIPNS